MTGDYSSKPQPAARSRRGVVVFAMLLAFAALGVSGYLSFVSLTGTAAAGCGGGSGCGAVLASPWAKVGPVPVSLLGAAAYLVVLFGLTPRLLGWRLPLGDALLLACAAAMISAAAWFTYIQLVQLEEVCPYCMADHALGVLLSICLFALVLPRPVLTLAPPVLAGVLGVAGLALVQQVSPTIDGAKGVDNPFADRDSDRVIDGQRHVSLFGGELQVVLEDEPHLGRADAGQVVGLVFDYGCPHCRAMHALVDEALEADPSRFAVLPLPISIDEGRNPYLNDENPRFDDSYDLATLSLAVAAVDLAQWRLFDRWLFAPDDISDFPRSAEQARDKASQLIGQEALDRELTGEVLDRHHADVDRNIALLGLIPEDNRRIPVTTAPGVQQHRTERFYDVSEINSLLEDAAAGLEAIQQAQPTTEP